MFYHRMYLRRCSMSSISEESETADDDQTHSSPSPKTDDATNIDVQTCLGDLSSFKQEIREAYEDLSSLERQARCKTIANRPIDQEDDLDLLLEQLHTLEQRLEPAAKLPLKKSISSAIIAQFDQLDQALATLTSTMNNVEIELIDSGNSSSSSAISDSTRIHQHGESDEHFSDSGLSQSTDSISLPLMHQQLSNASSVFSCDTLRTNGAEHQIRLALKKMHEANIKKLFVKIHNDDQSTKNVLIDETMSVHQLVLLLLHKYHLQPTLNYVIVEDLPDLHLLRIFEDHQNLINDGLIYWPRDTQNRIRFREEKDRYAIFEEPKKFFSNGNETNEKFLADLIHGYQGSKMILLPDDITSILYIKDKTRKVWKKSTCVLRQSGIYQLPKSSSSSKHDLICLVKFDKNIQLYQADQWIDAFRSPTEHGFALKYAHIQKKSNKYIHHLCAQTFDDCQRWMNGIRLILFGEQVYQNYRQMQQVVHDGFENLVNRLPEQRQFNFIQSITSSMHESLSTISLPINQIICNSMDTSKSLVDLDLTPSNKPMFFSLDRQKKSKTSFTRSSSFHSNLHQNKASTAEQKFLRTKSISPTKKNDESVLKRSKSARDIFSRSKSHQSKKEAPSILPLIHQCIHSDRTPTHDKSVKRSADITPTHIYDSLQEMPFPTDDLDHRTVSISTLPPTRVTEL